MDTGIGLHNFLADTDACFNRIMVDTDIGISQKMADTENGIRHISSFTQLIYSERPSSKARRGASVARVMDGVPQPRPNTRPQSRSSR